ncbi:MAG: hypothetical protein BWY04_00493 [candidate division CPR1 bacterium ADurb.Bin160]|uniref:Uncharacterized protein n=1 Tax=candidate division CPR1 bacterium ADurb.Bin160 TaxID=1852826 RepID=A0A1V5ZP52_9BACT|nr:MAG: hypothetical protein BWY04_00493 [candidate division CPR1 bacterium ADurb.Bin160]
MAENLFCENQKTITDEYRKNWERTFLRFWIIYRDEFGQNQIGEFRKNGDCFEHVLYDNKFLKNSQIISVWNSKSEAEKNIMKNTEQ